MIVPVVVLSIDDLDPEIFSPSGIAQLRAHLLPTQPMKNRQREKRSRVSPPRRPTTGQVLPAEPRMLPSVRLSKQRESVNQCRESLKQARSEYYTALAAYDQTPPSHEDFNGVADRLELATVTLAGARDSFKRCCATI
jgi:hypothetical protein